MVQSSEESAGHAANRCNTDIHLVARPALLDTPLHPRP
jgi:hypothetical protein